MFSSLCAHAVAELATPMGHTPISHYSKMNLTQAQPSLKKLFQRQEQVGGIIEHLDSGNTIACKTSISFLTQKAIISLVPSMCQMLYLPLPLYKEFLGQVTWGF